MDASGDSEGTRRAEMEGVRFGRRGGRYDRDGPGDAPLGARLRGEALGVALAGAGLRLLQVLLLGLLAAESSRHGVGAAGAVVALANSESAEADACNVGAEGGRARERAGAIQARRGWLRRRCSVARACE